MTDKPPAVAPRETQTELQGADEVLYRLLKFAWLEGYSDTSPIVAEAEAFVRARLGGS